MLSWIYSNTRKDNVRNEDIIAKVCVAPVKEKM